MFALYAFLRYILEGWYVNRQRAPLTSPPILIPIHVCSLLTADYKVMKDEENGAIVDYGYSDDDDDSVY